MTILKNWKNTESKELNNGDDNVKAKRQQTVYKSNTNFDKAKHD